jgi:hypothetical protein
MASKKAKRLTPAEQSARFIETARKIGTDERPEEFGRVLGKVAKQRPSKSVRKP